MRLDTDNIKVFLRFFSRAADHKHGFSNELLLIDLVFRDIANPALDELDIP
jgi:hypothetical protein